MSGRVVHVNDNTPGAVYIGRAVPRLGIALSRWANPYRIGRNAILAGRDLTRAEAIAYFREEILTGVLRNDLPYLPALRGKPLACWCRHDGETEPACHGDVLLELLANFSDSELMRLGAGEIDFAGLRAERRR